MESRVVHDGNEELIIFKAICYFQSEREEIPSQPTNAPPSYTSTAAVDGGWRGAYQHDFVCSSKASPQGNRAQEQGISTAFFLRSRRSNPRLLDQIPRLNCSCIRRFNCDIYESMANIARANVQTHEFQRCTARRSRPSTIQRDRNTKD